MRMRMWVAPLALLFLATVASASRGTIQVVNGKDDGAGSFRDAVEQANKNSRIKKIEFVDEFEIDVESKIEYTGTQRLKITGWGSTLKGDCESDYDLFESSGGANIEIFDLIFEDGGARGCVISIPSSATGRVNVKLDHCDIVGNKKFGLHIDDDNSSAGVNLVMKYCLVEDNGKKAKPGEEFDDQDGIRVDERGKGSIKAYFFYCDFIGNLYDGVELDESGDGDAISDAIDCRFDENGFGSIVDSAGEDDPEDGFDIDEAGPGKLDAYFFCCTANDNDDEGIDLDEDDAGDLKAVIIGCDVNGNADEGIKFTESENDVKDGGGDVKFRIVRTVTNDNGGDGIKAEEFGDGDNIGRLVKVEVDNNDDGVECEEFGDGDLKVTLVRCTVSNNDDDGVVAEESDDGDLDLRIRNSKVLDNDDDGVKAEQGDDGEGCLRIRRTTIDGNGDDEPNTDNVDEK